MGVMADAASHRAPLEEQGGFFQTSGMAGTIQPNSIKIALSCMLIKIRYSNEA